MRFSVVVVLVGLLVGLAACGPTSHRGGSDEWDDDRPAKEPMITGDNARDEARWRRELASDPWDDDSALLTDDPPKSAAEYQDDEDIPPLDFVGPPEPPSTWDDMQRSSTKVGKVFFSIMTVLVTLGMMAAPYLMMI